MSLPVYPDKWAQLQKRIVYGLILLVAVCLVFGLVWYFFSATLSAWITSVFGLSGAEAVRRITKIDEEYQSETAKIRSDLQHTQDAAAAQGHQDAVAAQNAGVKEDAAVDSSTDKAKTPGQLARTVDKDVDDAERLLNEGDAELGESTASRK